MGLIEKTQSTLDLHRKKYIFSLLLTVVYDVSIRLKPRQKKILPTISKKAQTALQTKDIQTPPPSEMVPF